MSDDVTLGMVDPDGAPFKLRLPTKFITGRVIRRLCPVCGERPPQVEIEGRVLVCGVCADDTELRAHAVEDWR